jgi:predicted anti-sigma-YlaC factor YlaD
MRRFALLSRPSRGACVATPALGVARKCLIGFGFLAAMSQTGCIKSMAVNALGDALSKGGGTYAQDDDPELVRDATAFGLKTIESLLDAEPEHKGLHLAAARGFTQYAFAYLQSEADYIEATDFERAAHLRKRAHRMFRRALAYGARGLSLGQDDFLKGLRQDAPRTLKAYEKEDVPLLVWTALAFGAGIAINKDDADMGADLGLVEPIMLRALALDPDHGEGAIHDFFISWYSGRPESAGGSDVKAREHFEKARALAKGRRMAPLVSFAEGVSAKLQNREEFEKLLKEAVAFDADSVPEHRLANLIAQKRARWLLAHADDLFI